MALLEFNEEDASSVDASLRFVFDVEGLKIRTSNRLVITDAFMTKLRGLAKKWHTAYIHAYFAAHSKAAEVIGEDVPDTDVEDIDPDDFPPVDVDPFEDFMDNPDE